MTKNELVGYFHLKAHWRQEKANPYFGQNAVIKNEIYASRLEKVAEYVESLPEDDPTILKLEHVPDLCWPVDDIHASDIHNATIHCFYRKPHDIPSWFNSWANMVASLYVAEEETVD